MKNDVLYYECTRNVNTEREVKTMVSAVVIGERLRTHRGEKSREEVSSACDISVSALAMYETGQRVPRDEIKCKLASYYNTSIEALFYTV